MIRQIIKKAVKIDSLYYIIALCLCVLAFYVFVLPEVSATTRGELDTMEKNLSTYEAKFNELIIDIEEEKEIIAKLKETLAIRIDKERIARNLDNIFNTEQTRNDLRNARDNVRTTTNELKQENIDLQSLINRKLVIQANIKSITKVIDVNVNLIKKNSIVKEYGLTRMIGVDLSTVCKTMIINNLTSACPDYGKLLSLDNSDYRSGSFDYIDGMFQRGKPLLNNDHRLYDFDTEYKIIVDPSGIMKSNIRMVTIELNFNTYLTAGDFIKANNTRTINHDLYVDNCKNATISASSWLETLPAVIFFMRGGCDESVYNPQTIIYDEVTDYTYEDSPAYQRIQQAEALKAKYKENRIGLD